MEMMIVDDDSDDTDLFCEALKEVDSSIKCLIARDGEEALNLLKNLTVLPDLIFLDINMPRMNGKTCFREIRKNPLLRNIPIVIYSTSARPDEIKEFESQGATFMAKPSGYSDLVNVLMQFFSRDLKKRSK
jgi:CheY-like chemotaxis protein